MKLLRHINIKVKLGGYLFFLNVLVSTQCHASLALTQDEKNYLANKPIITFASQSNYAPFEFINNDGESAGIVVELVKWIGLEAGFEARFIHSDFKGAQDAVLLGKVDAITSLFYSDTRALKFGFTESMMEVPASIFVRKEDKKIQVITDLTGKKLAMQRGDYAEEFLKKKGINIEVVYRDDFPSALNSVLNSEAEAIIGDEQVIFYEIFQAQLKSKFRVTDQPIYIGKNCIATKKDNLILISIFNKGLAAAKSKGVLNNISREWGGNHITPKAGFWHTFRQEAGFILASILVSFLAIFFWNMQLRKTVEVRTRDIKKRELAYRALTENSMDLVVRHDSNQNILYVNLAAARFVDKRIRDMVGVSLKEAGFPDEIVERWEEGVREVFLSGRSFSVQMESRSGKNPHWLDCRLVPEFGGYNQVESVLSTCCDITENKKAEEERRFLEIQMQQAQKLECLGVMAGGIAHDFNNLLATIQGNAELALMEKSVAEKQRSYLETTLQTTNSATSLCSQMLAYSGKGKFTTDHIDINRLIRSTLPLLELSLAKRAHLELNLVEELPMIEGDKTQLQQILMNLAINAAESIHANDYGRIIIETKLLECAEVFLRELSPNSELTAGNYIQITLSDTGCGMTSETLSKIFDLFFTTKFTGRGLGLAAVLGIVKSHNGYLNVTSVVGVGSKFMIGFPVAKTQPAILKSQTVQPASQWRGRGLILLADDEKPVLTVTKKLLEKAGFAVIFATNGSDAVDIFRSESEEIRAVMLDYNMPVMDGVTAMKEIRKIKSDAIIILSSGYHEVEASSMLNNQDRPTAFLEKPYTFTKLLDTLQRHLS